MKKIISFISVSTFLLLMQFITACSSSSSDSAGTSPAYATITGSVFAAPVSGATVTIMNAGGTALATAITKTDGTYSVRLLASALSGTLLFESMGGTFVDEATSLTTTAGRLSATVPGGSVSSGGAVHIDTISTIVSKLVASYGKSMDDAKTAVAAACGFVPDPSVAPVLSSGTYTASSGNQRIAGLISEVISGLSSTLGLTPDQQFDLLEVIAEDLSDGKLDGKNGTTALFVNGKDLSTLNLLNTFESALETASRVALSSSYKVVYSYPMGSMGANKGKTKFRLTITDPSGTTPIPGLMLMLMPMMHMPGHAHGAPVDSTIVDNGNGTYDCTIYYLMSTIMKGTAMGYWELQVMISDMMSTESVYFYPNVGMPMGDTVSATMIGTDLLYSDMTMTSAKRNYYLFNDGVISGASSTLNLYIATQDIMMSYPAVSSAGTTTLHDENNAPWTITDVVVKAYSFDWGTEVTATDNTKGHWSMTNLGLSSGGTRTTIHVTLKVNGDIKTSNTLTYVDFAVTP